MSESSLLTRWEMDEYMRQWLTDLLYQEDRDTHATMTDKQKRVVKLAFQYGRIVGRENT